MIQTFKHKGLERYFKASDKRGLPAHCLARIERILDVLDVATVPSDMALPGLKFHALTGDMAGIYAVTVTGNMRMTFRFEGQHATDVDFVDYH